MPCTPADRIRTLCPAPVNPRGAYVLYWMTAARRATHNFALQRAAELGRELDRPLVVLEALRLDHPWASPRLHAFILQGMADNARRLARRGVLHHPYVEPAPGAGKGLLSALAARACAVVTDDFPCFFLPRMLAAAAAQVEARLEAVDSNGLLPLAATRTEFSRALDMRRFLQRHLPQHLERMPAADPLAPDPPRGAVLPPEVARRWPPADPDLLRASPTALGRLPLGLATPPSPLTGGARAADAALARFLEQGLPRYLTHRAQPLAGAASGLSPYLHFGHVSAHEVFLRLADREGWAPHRLGPQRRGGRQGFWGMSDPAEAFLDQLVTWRELGYHFCRHRPDHDRYQSLPPWARATLEAHAGDPRPYVYGLDQLLAAQTHDPIWNAGMRQLLTQGVMDNYLRMLWGKKILQWSPDPRQALEVMIELNNRLALDGRDPNSYSGIFWCLGGFDRPWAPERPVFGRVRYMSSQRAARKLDLVKYLEIFGLQR